MFAWMTVKSEASSERMLNEKKHQLFQDIAGTVVEIGPGTGVNLPYYPADIRWIAIEPNPAMHSHLQQRANKHPLAAEIRQGTAERMDLPDDSADVVVSTLVLCSVKNLEQVLSEIYRVLKPGGRFIFLEHVAAPEGTSQRRHQNLVQPLWSFFGDGCRPNRETAAALQQARFESVDLREWRIEVPITSPMISGVAIKTKPQGAAV